MVIACRLALVAALATPGAIPAIATQAVAPMPTITSTALLRTTTPIVTSTTLLRTTTTWNGVPIVYSRTEKPEVQTLVVEIAPRKATVWHMHPVNNIAYILEGKVRLELENGTTRDFKAGEAFAEVVNTWHRGVNTGTGPLRILVVYTSELGTPLSIPKGDQLGE